jgi:hypothetical protein
MSNSVLIETTSFLFEHSQPNRHVIMELRMAVKGRITIRFGEVDAPQQLMPADLAVRKARDD